MTPELLDALETIVAKLQAEMPVLWMFDYDGTLVPLAPRPELAVPSSEVSSRLRALCRVKHLCPAIISGRSVSQLKAMLPALSGEPFLMCGLHGGEMYDSASETMLYSPESRLAQQVRGFHQRISVSLEAQGIHDVFLEDKTYALALHTRGATAENGRRAQVVFESLYRMEELFLEKDFRLQFGKMIVELVPKSFHKGNSVTLMMNQAFGKGSFPFPVYIGDDLTDESAFEAVNVYGGLSIRVAGSDVVGETHATCCLPGVGSVQGLIQQVLERMCGDVQPA